MYESTAGTNAKSANARNNVTDNPWKWMIISGSSLAGLWMKIPYTVQVLLMLMGLDILSGLCAAFVQKQLNSSVMLRGLFTKAAVFPLLALLHIIEQPLNLPFNLAGMGAIAFIVYESMSIIENCANAGVPIPAVIVTALAKAKIPTATAADIHREFAVGDTTSVAVNKSTEIIKTPPTQPDLKVDKTTTVVEEKHVEPIHVGPVRTEPIRPEPVKPGV